ncbi:MAG: hypothetical protein LBP36_01695 [Oscillospiraceae bacterium]|jgi:hypothetical protein|nr:hypothetical protein [Oscillospiraceae bacterium]
MASPMTTVGAVAVFAKFGLFLLKVPVTLLGMCYLMGFIGEGTSKKVKDILKPKPYEVLFKGNSADLDSEIFVKEELLEE